MAALAGWGLMALSVLVLAYLTYVVVRPNRF
jgi:uncharacterized membrane protein YukC